MKAEAKPSAPGPRHVDLKWRGGVLDVRLHLWCRQFHVCPEIRPSHYSVSTQIRFTIVTRRLNFVPKDIKSMDIVYI